MFFPSVDEKQALLWALSWEDNGDRHQWKFSMEIVISRRNKPSQALICRCVSSSGPGVGVGEG